MQNIQALLAGPTGKIPLEATRFAIGRAPDNQLVLSNDPKVSSRHAEIRSEGQNHTIVDLGSTNHTFVNEQELYHNPPRLLRHGDIIRIGDTQFTYEVMNTFQNQPPVSDGSTMRAEAGSMGPVGRVGGIAEQFGTNYGAISDADETYLKPQSPFSAPPPRQEFVAPPVPPSGPPPVYPAPPPVQNLQNQSYNPTVYSQQEPPQFYPPPLPGDGTGAGSGTMQNTMNAPFIPDAPPRFVPPPKRRGLSIGLIVLVILALLIIIGSASFLFIAHNNQVAINDASATSTAVAQTQVVQGTATAHAQATGVVVHATATFIAQFPNPYPPHTGTLVFFDALTDASSVPTNKWDENSNCQFRNGGYHVTEAHRNTFLVCGAHATNFANFAYRVEATIAAGDCGGVAFRSDSQNQNLYLYEVCQNGTFSLATYSGTSGQYLIDHQSNAAIKRGTGQTNLIAVVANGSTINLYANNVLLGSQNDTKFSFGQIGLYADDYTSATTDVQFNNARVWKI
ncbi:MAG: FHA domain-containing protein [Ktedonobacteraceae bacterium]